MMMNSSCIAGCLDAQNPVKVSFVRLYQWAEADAEFLRKVSMNSKDKGGQDSSSLCRHENHASRQRYLRSYTFSKKETVSEKTKKWLKVKHTVKAKSKTDRSGSGSGSCPFLRGVFNFLFLCVAKVDIHDDGPAPAAASATKTSAVSLVF